MTNMFFLQKIIKKYVVELNYTDFINYDSPLGVAIEIDQKIKEIKDLKYYRGEVPIL